jgi:hypothetical protein
MHSAACARSGNPPADGARTVTFDSKTNHILTMSDERGPAPPPPPGGGRGARAPAVPRLVYDSGDRQVGQGLT